MYTLAIGLGSNLGDREENLKRAAGCLEELLTETEFSSIYETEPVGYEEQPWFLNQVCLGKTVIYPLELLFELKKIEKELGRTPGPRFGPRLIDLDILYYSDWVIVSHPLVLPHPRLIERSFVIKPLLEVAGDWVDPVSGEKLSEVWRREKDALSVCLPYKKMVR